MKSSVHLVLQYQENLVAHRSTNFEELKVSRKKAKTDRGTITRDSDRIYDDINFVSLIEIYSVSLWCLHVFLCRFLITRVIQRHTITFFFSARVMFCADTAAQDVCSVACNMPSTLAVSGGASTAVVGLYLVRTVFQQIGKGAIEAVHSFRVRPSCMKRFCPPWIQQRSQSLCGCWWCKAMPYLLGLIWVTPAMSGAGMYGALEHWRFWQVVMADFSKVSQMLEAERALHP